jgi:hypothetical protein
MASAGGNGVSETQKDQAKSWAPIDPQPNLVINDTNLAAGSVVVQD